jgi:hypothetical protein
VSKASLLKQAAVSSKLYGDSLTTCKNFIDISMPSNISIDVLCLKYGCNDIVELARGILKEHRSSTRRPPVRETVEYLSWCHGAAFYLAVKRSKVRIYH